MSGIKLKLHVNTGANKAPSITTPATPAATPGGTIRPKLKFTTTSNPSTPVSSHNTATKKLKPSRPNKPSAKRIKDESENEDGNNSTIHVERPTKKIKLNVPRHRNDFPSAARAQKPKIKVKLKGEKPHRASFPGQGYDSEASDIEDDPAIEEQFILRMEPGEDCDYLRKAIAEKKIGVPRANGGADVHMRFLNSEGRRACITIRDHNYAATLVDLPCIIEGMKSWDKRGWWKSADICQMLLVFARVRDEAEATTIPLPDTFNHETYQYPHGLTPPMYYARQRRFRKRLHKIQIEAVEAQVERLLQADQNAESTSFRIFDPEAEERRVSQAFSPASNGDYDEEEEEYSEDEDADGEIDDSGYFAKDHHEGMNGQGYNHGMDVDQEGEGEGAILDLEAELEAAGMETPMENGMEDNSQMEAETPMSASVSTPAGQFMEESQGEDSGDESGDDGEGGEGGSEADEAAKAEEERVRMVKEDIDDMESSLKHALNQLPTTTNQLLRKRLEANIRKTREDIEEKKKTIGEGEGE